MSTSRRPDSAAFDLRYVNQRGNAFGVAVREQNLHRTDERVSAKACTVRKPPSRRPDVLVKQSTEPIVTLGANLVLLKRRCNQRDYRFWWLETQRSVRPVTIVMGDEDGQDPPEMLFVQERMKRLVPFVTW